jgi:hypothetical protein
MPTKNALILGVCQYDDAKLARLNCPSSDVASLAAVLQDPGLGGFDSVIQLVDEQRAVAERAITKLFNNKQFDDLVVLYFSGHGLRDDQGELYLAVRDTDSTDLDGTAIAAEFIKRVMDKSNCTRQVLILDCCHSGAFSAGFRGAKAEILGASVGTRDAFDSKGSGRIILTASDATQYALEGDTILGEAQTSRYTSFLIEGMKTGEADLTRDGFISVDELHSYVSRRTAQSGLKQTPTKICDREKGSLILCRAPLYAEALPEEVETALRSTLPSVRRAIVQELSQLFLDGSPGLALSAHKALVALKEDDSNSVRSAAAQALADCAGKRPSLSPTMLEDIAVAADRKVEDSSHLEALKQDQEDALRVRQQSPPAHPVTETPPPTPIAAPPAKPKEDPPLRVTGPPSAAARTATPAIPPPPLVSSLPRWLTRISVLKAVVYLVVGFVAFLLLLFVFEFIKAIAHPSSTQDANAPSGVSVTTTVERPNATKLSNAEPNAYPSAPLSANAPPSPYKKPSLDSSLACVFDPPSNLRAQPSASSDVVCTVNTPRVVHLVGPPVTVGNGVWWPTDDCRISSGYPGTAYIAANQIHTGAASCP